MFAGKDLNAAGAVHQRLARIVAKTAGPLVNSQSAAAPFFIGLVTTLLPCGWLYTFVALALAAANPLNACLIMFAFWLGTLPVMIGTGFASNYLIQRFGNSRRYILADNAHACRDALHQFAFWALSTPRDA